MMRTRLPALIVAVLAMLAPVAVVAVIAEPAAAASPVSWTCWRTKTYGKLRYRGQVEYSVTTQQRVSINRVTFDDAYWFPNSGAARRIGMTAAGLVAWREPLTPANIYRDAGTADGWTGASAVFHWPVKWVRATTDRPLYLRIDADSTAEGAGWCQAPELAFWG
jgi:hypothetical protein